MRILVFAFSLLIAGTAWSQVDPGDVMQCVGANVPVNLSLRRVSLTTEDRAGKSTTLQARIYAMREPAGQPGQGRLRAMMQIDAPENLAGAAYLVRETDATSRDGMYVYLPSVGRVRRVTGSFSDGALLGTKFSYFEFKQLMNAFRDLTPRALGRDKVGERPAFVVEFTPLGGADTRYTSVRAWFDQQSCLPLRADFRQGNEVVKRISAPASAISQAGDNWYLDQIRIKVLADGSQTVLRVNNVSLDEPMSGYYFDPETFYTVR